MTLQLHIIALGVLALLLVAATLIIDRRFRRTWKRLEGTKNPRWKYIDWSKDDLPSYYVRTIAIICTSIVVPVFIIALAPFQPRYWELTEHSGTVAGISNRFVDGSGDLSGATYTVTLAGDRTPRVVTDSRVLSLHVGDRVDMTCSLEWVYGGADRSNCFLRSF